MWAKLKLKIGRPSQYCKETTPAFVGYLAQEGKTEDEIAEQLHVSRQTLFTWKQKYPEFLDALKETKDEADAKVVQSLYQKALKGDVTACIFWLKNRQSAKWRDKQDVEVHLTADAIRLEVQKAIE